MRTRPFLLHLGAFLVVLGLAAWAPAQQAATGERPDAPTVPAADRTPIAAHGFARSVELAELDRRGDAKVAVAADADGPVALWEDGRGIVAHPLRPNGAPVRLHASRGVRGLHGGAAGGTAVAVWAERDLSDGSTALRAAWGDELRTVATFASVPQVRIVAGTERPELVTASPEAGGWTIDLHRWGEPPLRLADRDREVAGLDALRHEGGLHVAWIEGRTEIVLGRADPDWSAYRAELPSGASEASGPERLGEALRTRDLDVARLGVSPEGAIEVAWPTEAGLVAEAGGDRPPRPLGGGVLLGRPEGRWTWIDDVRLLQEREGRTVPVARLPSPPEHAVATAAAGTTAVVFSAGRYLGGVAVWAATDAEPYVPAWTERVAVALGWDPWRPGQEAAGHLAVATLAAVLIAVTVAPIWWAFAALLGRRGIGGGRRLWLEGGALGVGLILLLLLLFVRGSGFGPADARALVGGPLVWAVAAGVGLLAARGAVVRRDLEATMGRLAAAFSAGFATAWVVALHAAQPWLRLLASAA